MNAQMDESNEFIWDIIPVDKREFKSMTVAERVDIFRKLILAWDHAPADMSHAISEDVEELLPILLDDIDRALEINHQMTNNGTALFHDYMGEKAANEALNKYNKRLISVLEDNGIRFNKVFWE